MFWNEGKEGASRVTQSNESRKEQFKVKFVLEMDRCLKQRLLSRADVSFLKINEIWNINVLTDPLEDSPRLKDSHKRRSNENSRKIWAFMRPFADFISSENDGLEL